MKTIVQKFGGTSVSSKETEKEQRIKSSKNTIWDIK